MAGPQPAPSPRGSDKGKPEPATILIVHPMQSVRKSLSRRLTKGGYKVSAAASAADGKQSFDAAAGSCSLLLISTTLPDMSGMDLAHQLKELCPHLKVIYLSETSDWIRIRGPVHEGSNGLDLPVNPADLLSKVRHMIGG